MYRKAGETAAPMCKYHNPDCCVPAQRQSRNRRIPASPAGRYRRVDIPPEPPHPFSSHYRNSAKRSLSLRNCLEKSSAFRTAGCSVRRIFHITAGINTAVRTKQRRSHLKPGIGGICRLSGLQRFFQQISVIHFYLLLTRSLRRPNHRNGFPLLFKPTPAYNKNRIYTIKKEDFRRFRQKSSFRNSSTS